MNFEKYSDFSINYPLLFIFRNEEYINTNGKTFKDFMNGNIKAIENKKPTLNGKQISVSSTEKLDSAIIAINSSTLKNIKSNTNISNLLDEIRYPRCFGSAALEIAYVANGRLDGFIDYTNTLRLFDCLPSIYSKLNGNVSDNSFILATDFQSPIP